MRRTRGLPILAIVLGLSGWSAQLCVAGPPSPATNDEIKAMIAAAGDAKDYKNTDYVILLDEADVHVQNTGLATTESCQIIKILTDAGVRSHAALRYEFDPDTNRVSYRSVRIHRKDATIEDVPVSSVLKQSANQHAIYWGNEQYVLGLPRLDIGDCLEIRMSKTGFNIAYLGDSGNAGSGGAGGETLEPPMPGHWYETTLFQGHTPILKKRYSVHMPKDMPVQYQEYNGSLNSSLWFGDNTLVYTWWEDDIKPVKSEPRMTALDDNVPKLVMATVPDWPTKSRWFHLVNEPQFEANDAIRAKVKELTQDIEDEEGKILACLHWVADEVRYYGTSRGAREGFTLHTGIETFCDLGGVCKDKAGMLVTMMRVLGHETYPALTMAGSRVEEIPADQFNHTVTVQRMKDGSFRVLDPTWSPQSREIWSSWEAKQGLVFGTPEGQGLSLSPYFPPEYSTLAYSGNSSVAPDGELASRIVIDACGSPGTSFRRRVGGTPVQDRPGLYESALKIAPNAKLDAIETTEVYDYSRDSQMVLNVSADDYALVGDNTRMFHLPTMARPLGDFLSPDFNYPIGLKERKFDMRLRASRLLKIKETIKLPAGWEIEKLPDDKKIESDTTSLTFKTTKGDGELSYTLEMTIKSNIIPAKDYPSHKKAIETMKQLANEWVVCTVRDTDAKEVDND